MLVIVQVAGALLVLAPFAAHQFGKVNADAPGYLWPNLVGSAALAVLASVGGQWGFLLLEAAWAMVAARSILRARARGDDLTGLSARRRERQLSRSQAGDER